MPDFGFPDELIYELRNTKITSNLHNELSQGALYSIWSLLYRYISGNKDFERFNNLMNQFRNEKNDVICQMILDKVGKSKKIKFNQDQIDFYHNYNETRGKTLIKSQDRSNQENEKSSSFNI